VRSCYDELAQLLLAYDPPSGLTLWGNQGIGKSTFLGYLAWLVSKQSPPVPLLYHYALDSKNDVLLALLPNGQVTADWQPHISNSKCIYLVDNVSPLPSRGLTILVTSGDNPAATKMWYKRPSTASARHFMPVWSWVVTLLSRSH
jgi:energy-coupling factor transporter ATP-binding protein EcfA2